MKSIRRNLKVLAVAAALGAGLAGNAQAGVIAQSVLEITNLRFLNPDASLVSLSQVTPLIFSDSTDVTATLNGTSDVGSINLNTFGTLDLVQQCVGACGGFGQNDYTHHAAQTVIVARGDTILSGAPISGTGQPTGADAKTLAEAQVAPTNVGSTQSNLGLLATFLFSVAADQTVTIAFDADLYLIASLTADMQIGSNAQASSSWSIDVTDATTGNPIFTWNPNGGAGGIVGGTENADPCNLSQTVSSQLPGITITRACDASYSATSPTLVAGNFYQLNIRHTSEADATAVPEPSLIALLGIGLLGMGFGVRFSKKAAS